MTEAEAKAWLAGRDVPRETMERLEQFVALLLAENERQNLISAASAEVIWSRHIVDSSQLFYLGSSGGSWYDLGSGPGLPGIVLAILTPQPVLLIEPRKRRVEFLHAAIGALDLPNAQVEQARAEQVEATPAGNISARAFTSLGETFARGMHLADENTCWVLPKGQKAVSELEQARRTWQGVFHVEQSATDAASAIVVARQVRRREAS
jgi:16S rRNA (guanine527-N7)-methyltransferase